MKSLVLLALASLNVFTVAASNNAMEKHGVVPDVISKPPPALEAEYTGGVKVNQGNELTPTQVKNPPSLKWPVEDNGFYLLAVVDPDAPSRKEPKFREWHHWLVGNIPGMDIKKGDVLSEYIGAGPPEGTGLHRYVILVYKQPGKTQFSEERLTNKSSKGRGKFSIKSFADKYKLGEPIAGNFFQAQFDSYVPQLYKQLGS